MLLIHAVWAGLTQSLGFFWDSLFGLIFGFLISAIVQVTLTPATMERYLGGNARGILSGTLFGIISSACSYGAAAAARGFYRNGADIRSVFAFLISSTNMNLAIVILFWSLLGWRFAFAEFFGGIIIIAVVVTGFSIMLRNPSFEMRLSGAPQDNKEEPHDDHCHHSHHHEGQLTQNVWQRIMQTALSDVRMLQNELIIGYLIAGFAAAWIPLQWLSNALQYVGSVPFIGYILLLLVGLLLAIATFICSMGNVPIARFLAMAGIPLGANTTFIYGDLLIPPLIGIYRKSFPPKVVWSFLIFFTIGALLAGAIVDLIIGHDYTTTAMGSMSINDHFTLIANILAIAALGTFILLSIFAKGKLR